MTITYFHENFPGNVDVHFAGEQFTYRITGAGAARKVYILKSKVSKPLLTGISATNVLAALDSYKTQKGIES